MLPKSVLLQPIRARILSYPLGIWLAMAVVAVLNGGLRETVLIPRMNEHSAHAVSTALLVVAILGIAAFYFRRTSIEYTYLELLVVGLMWTVLTVGFEFVIGYVEGTPVSVTLGQYNVLAGQVWIAVPLTLFCSPLLFGWYFSNRTKRTPR